MRIRTAIAAVVLGLGLIVLGPGVAHAQSSSSSSTASTSSTSSEGSTSSSEAKTDGEAAKDCIKLLEDGHKIDDCQKAPSPILPATNELIWATISFFVLFFLLWKF